MSKLFYLILILTLHSAPAYSRNTEWALGADVKFESLYFAEDIGANTNQNLNKFTLNPNYRWKYLENLRFVLKGDFTWDPQNKSTEEQTFTDLSDLYLKFSKGSWSFQAGYATYAWGTTDGYSPLDVINSKQYYDPLHSKKLGAPSVAFNWTGESVSLDAVYIPLQRESLLPGPQSRWLPRDVYVPEVPDNNLVLLLPKDLRFHYGARTQLDEALKNNGALRLQAHVANIDLTVMAFEGAPSFPLVEPLVDGNVIQVSPKTVVQMNPDVTLNLKDYRERRAGFSFVSSQYDFLLKYAGSYAQPLGDYANLPGWTQENVLGLEKTFEVGSEGTLIAILQHSFIESERSNDSNLSFTEIFRRAFMLGGRLSWKEVWVFNFLGLYDSKNFSHLGEFGISRRFFDAWTLTANATVIDGPETSTLGTYRKNDSYALSLSRSF